MTERSVAQRGRPRSEKARLAILAATTEVLLERGLAGTSMDVVAGRAGVGKATIYRWWPTKEALALEALYHSWAVAVPDEPDTGSLRGDLAALLLPWARRLRTQPYGRIVAAFITEAQTNSEFEKEYHAQAPSRAGARRDRARRCSWGDPGGYERRAHSRPAVRPAVPPAASPARAAQRPLRDRHRRCGVEGYPPRAAGCDGQGER